MHKTIGILSMPLIGGGKTMAIAVDMETDKAVRMFATD